MSNEGYKFGFLGSGKMATALISAILRGKLAIPDEIICSDVSLEQLESVKKQFDVRITQQNKEVIKSSEIVVLSFKPQNFPQAIIGLPPVKRQGQIIISIIAGIRISKIQKYFPHGVVRVMPNTPSLVGQMAAGYSAAEDVTPEQVEQVRKILQSAGVAVEVSEEQLDPVTGLSGSGPAFVAHLIEAFIAAGTDEGLDKSVARTLALQTFAGTAELLSQWKMEPDELINMVSSPNGTTVAGREILEASDVSDIIKQTIKRAAQRSRELGQNDKER